MSLAWHTAVLSTCDPKKRPSLERLLGRAEKAKVPAQQSDDELLAMMRTWAAMQNEAVRASTAGTA